MISANHFIGDSSGYALGTGGLIFIGIYVKLFLLYVKKV